MEPTSAYPGMTGTQDAEGRGCESYRETRGCTGNNLENRSDTALGRDIKMGNRTTTGQVKRQNILESLRE